MRMHLTCNLNKVNASLVVLADGRWSARSVDTRYRINSAAIPGSPWCPIAHRTRIDFVSVFLAFCGQRCFFAAVKISSTRHCWDVALHMAIVWEGAPGMCTHFMNCVSLSPDLQLLGLVSTKIVHFICTSIWNQRNARACESAHRACESFRQKGMERIYAGAGKYCKPIEMDPNLTTERQKRCKMHTKSGFQKYSKQFSLRKEHHSIVLWSLAIRVG